MHLLFEANFELKKSVNFFLFLSILPSKIAILAFLSNSSSLIGFFKDFPQKFFNTFRLISSFNVLGGFEQAIWLNSIPKHIMEEEFCSKQQLKNGKILR